MQVELGAHVHSRDGQDLGRIKFLILDPLSREIKTVVVEKGWLLVDDVEVPIEALEDGDSRNARLSYTAEEVKQLPRFDESQYLEVPEDQALLFPGMPPGGLLWPVAYNPAYGPGLYPPVVPFGQLEEAAPPADREAEIERRPHHDESVISSGSDVFSADGAKVGEVHNVVFDTATGKPTALVISKGFMFTQHIELPSQSIASVADGVVHLNLTAREVQQAKREHNPTPS